MGIVIGGSPSTGSSLLRQLLNRHSAIYCGPETKLFAYPQLYTDWHKYKWGLVEKPLLVAPDVHIVSGSNLAGAEQKVNENSVRELLGQTSSLVEFAEKYFQIPCGHYGKVIWAEKTPANVLTFQQFESNFEDPVLVHIVRDPLDTIASLQSRGLSIFQSVSRYLFSTAYGLASSDSERYVPVRYEELTRDPARALTGFFNKTGLSFEPGMLRPGNTEMTETGKMEGWTHDETEPPRKMAVGRFGRLPERQQMEILSAISLLKIDDLFADKRGLQHRNVLEIAGTLGYELPELASFAPGVKHRLKRERLIKSMRALIERRHTWPLRWPIAVGLKTPPITYI